MKLRRPMVAALAVASTLGAWSMVRTDGPEPVVPLSPATPESLDFYEDPREARVPRIIGELRSGATLRNNGFRPYARDGWRALVPDSWSGRTPTAATGSAPWM